VLSSLTVRRVAVLVVEVDSCGGPLLLRGAFCIEAVDGLAQRG